MKRLLLILAILLIPAVIGWQIAVIQVENDEFANDLNDLAVHNNARTGLMPIMTEDELKGAVMASAQRHGIQLAPDHFTVHRVLTPGTVGSNGMPETPAMLDISIATEYDAPVKLPGLAFNLHFAPAASHSAPVILK